MSTPNEKTADQWSWAEIVTHVAAWALVLCTLILLFVGASVTSYDVGMAVPDAPTTFGQNVFLYNFFKAPFGVQVEHVHRLLGYLVGFVAITVTLGLFLIGKSLSRRWLGAGVLLAVLLQGLLGRFRVELNDMFGREFAAAHGCLAQLCFALMVVVLVVTGRRWKRDAGVVHPHAGRARWATISLLVTVYLQIVLGAVFRHLHLEIGFILHLSVAFLLLTGSVAALGWFAADAGYRQALLRPVGCLTGFLLAQIFLGIGAALATQLAPAGLAPAPTHGEALLASLHVIGGSLTLASAVVLALASFRYLKPRVSTRRPSQAAPTDHKKVGV